MGCITLRHPVNLDDEREAQLSAMLLGRSPELGIWAFTECQSPMIDEAFLLLDIRTAIAVIEQLSLACNWRQFGSETT